MKPNQRFHSLLLCVESKVDGILVNALGQLVVYLASLRQSRIDRGKKDSSVYGVVTDGFIYIFVTITHEGVLKKSRAVRRECRVGNCVGLLPVWMKLLP
jgi:hypothetical protein